MLGEVQAITRNPPGGVGATGQSNTFANAQTLTLVATTSSAVTTILLTPQTGGCFVTFRNVGTSETHIRFGTVSAGPGAALATDYPIPAGASEEWWITSEINFTAINSAAAVLTWYRSSL
jgi:hypothetical protein